MDSPAQPSCVAHYYMDVTSSIGRTSPGAYSSPRRTIQVIGLAAGLVGGLGLIPAQEQKASAARIPVLEYHVVRESPSGVKAFASQVDGILIELGASTTPVPRCGTAVRITPECGSIHPPASGSADVDWP